MVEVKLKELLVLVKLADELREKQKWYKAAPDNAGLEFMVETSARAYDLERSKVIL